MLVSYSDFLGFSHVYMLLNFDFSPVSLSHVNLILTSQKDLEGKGIVHLILQALSEAHIHFSIFTLLLGFLFLVCPNFLTHASRSSRGIKRYQS